MPLISETLKSCSVKIKSIVAGVPSIGSGVIYQTPNKCHYNYILTAKHLLSEDSHTGFEFNKLQSIEISYYSDKFERLSFLKNNSLNENNIIIFEKEDLAILKIQKIEGFNFPSILVSDELENDEITFSCWSVFKANEDALSLFKFNRNDPSEKKINLENNITKEYLNGLSGSGVFIHNKNILLGVISKYPNENFENSTIECSRISFASINSKLHELGLIQLDTKESRLKREIGGKIVELYQAQINNSYLDLNTAIHRTRTDMNDDWFYDSLQYIDLLNSDYLYAELREYFYQNSYEASKAEKFYIPKNNFTLREAYIIPLIDRIIYMAIVGELGELIDDSLIPNVFSARYNRVAQNSLIINGVEQWLKLKYKISQEVNEIDNNQFKFNCILQVDILNYYDNIDKKLLIEKLKRIASNNNHLNTIHLLEKFLFSYSKKSTGLPQNNDASALLSSFYLNQVDVFVNNHTQSYYRFADDIKILCKDKYEARKFLVLLEKELKRCQLSVNSQKTKIVEIVDSYKEKSELIITRKEISSIFNPQIELIKVLSKSSNYQYRNEAFHSAIDLLSKNINIDGNENDNQARNLIFALRIIEHLGKSKIHFQTYQNELFKSLSKAVKVLKDKPWITPQICKILSLIEFDQFSTFFGLELKKLVLDEDFNLYPYQQFQIWLLFTKQKFKCNDLIMDASQKIEINDSTQKATTAAQILYLSTVDKHFKRILLRKLEENFTTGYFQNRAALIALRSFNLIEPKKEVIHLALSNSFAFTSKFGYKDLVFYHEIELNPEDQDLIEELFSI
ncbi:reverse transcriptase (RNA-dependent DNA polymerase) [Tenacibaculum gallaicum]|uniref:Reverse transcriptase (RNA-dependent DNA polymerase) n=1 Tax=Tenacibaculum gallaicum TaxID=561505 RepID=A0A3E0HDT8_9FLAO|nr:RNA-directed DNA polymerase [Tenacibaculum gallaicum]REH43392.1 reverse transcriptase (RNA-dependent DNA polymerase) [Tenacibaculum gallaicum]